MRYDVIRRGAYQQKAERSRLLHPRGHSKAEDDATHPTRILGQLFGTKGVTELSDGPQIKFWYQSL